MNRLATYDFLLTFYSYYKPISYHFQDKQIFQSKIANLAVRMHATK